MSVVNHDVRLLVAMLLDPNSIDLGISLYNGSVKSKLLARAKQVWLILRGSNEPLQ
jgi:hypothetical protein